MAVRNIGTADGRDRIGRRVRDTDDAIVTIVLPRRITRLPRTGIAASPPMLGVSLLLLAAALAVVSVRRRRAGEPARERPEGERPMPLPFGDAGRVSEGGGVD